ncbi:MAG: hypothetical protein ACOZBH_00790 [Patescibacteria group bacterium]
MKEKNQRELAYWHNQKGGEFDPETGVIFEPGTEEYNKWLEFYDYIKLLGKSKIEQTPNYEKIHQFLEQIDRTQVIGDSADNKKHQQILQKQKQTAKKMIDDSIAKAIKYIEIVLSQEGNIRKYGRSSIKEIETSELRRRAAHDALISSLTIANRYIYQHFGQLTPEQLDEFQDREEAAGREFIEIDRIDIPEMTFLTADVNLANRQSVALWAYNLLREIRFKEAA